MSKTSLRIAHKSRGIFLSKNSRDTIFNPLASSQRALAIPHSVNRLNRVKKLYRTVFKLPASSYQRALTIPHSVNRLNRFKELYRTVFKLPAPPCQRALIAQHPHYHHPCVEEHVAHRITCTDVLMSKNSHHTAFNLPASSCPGGGRLQSRPSV